MALTKETESLYVALLFQELAAAEGCTEPIAIAYAAALCTKTLGRQPGSLHAAVSGNIIKNARCAVVPHTGGLRGMKAAAVAGAVGGDADRQLEVISGLTTEHIARMHTLLQGDYCTVSLLDSDEPLHIVLEASGGGDSCTVEILHAHTHVHRITKNGKLVYDADTAPQAVDMNEAYEALTLDGIFEFVETVELSRVEELMEKQLRCNIAICEEGLKNRYGACIGQLLLETGSGIENRAMAYAAAGSDARMSGCPMPVVINSGSGNQGITVTAPVWIYAEFLRVGKEKLHRALLLSNLLALYQKRLIGKLSAYCGAVSAACGSAAAVTSLCGGSREQVCSTLSNALVINSGMLCDGAKPSCAAKIASSVYAGLLAHKMAMESQNFMPCDGLVGRTTEETVSNIGYLAHNGLVEIDKMMLELMLQQC